ncbi:MAG: DNA polymerase III subunit gamma/tau [Bacilli bacterium]|nr:DNA polymerase III subunit gamma/tau [Bacilli bacterium]MDD4733253.1 DNA polymerase III subunit gamma/tau [Bacilli bacterium]
MYQALYRKYRPSSFEEVTGQNVIITTLQNSIINNKLSHAYLFTGPRGTGKTSVAKILAKTINCASLKGAKLCDKCVNCTQYNLKQTMDIIEIDAATNNGIEEIRDLRNKANLVPSTGKYKVYIIDEVHMLSPGAFNGLLKTLEEPPAHVIFILATTEPHKIPMTILSRCQRFDFKKISIIDLNDRLSYICKKEKIDIDKDALFEISRLSDGGMRDAISMLDQVVAYSSSKVTIKEVHDVNGTITQVELKSFIEDLFNKNIVDILNKLDNYNNEGKNLKKLSEEIVIYLKNILLYKTVPNYFLGNKVDIECYKALSPLIQKENLIKMISSFNSLLNDVKYVNDPKLNIELLIIALINEEEKLTLSNNKEDVVENKKEIEKKEQEFVEKVPTSIKKETSSPLKNTIDSNNNKIIDCFDKLKDIRINNTLNKIDKKRMIEIKKMIESSKGFILNKKYGDLMSLILDSKIKACGNNYLIFVYDSDRMSDFFNENILQIEELIKKITKEEFKVISTCINEWNIIKEEFNNRKKKYTFTEETNTLSILKKKEEDQMLDFFGDIVEYN